MRKKKSILFVRPDYHCSFFYREQFRKLGWKADIFLPRDYPEGLLYSDKDLLKPLQFVDKSIFILKVINHFLFILWWLTKFWRYKYHFYYRPPPAVDLLESRSKIHRIFGSGFLFELFLAKLFKVKLIYLSSGCLEDETKENFMKLDQGNVCNNCGLWNKCDDKINKNNFSIINRYFDMVVGFGCIDSTQMKMTHFKYKSIDLSLWNPNLIIPSDFILPSTNNIRILHSNYLSNSGRDFMNRNIKGSPFILAAIERLKNEGHSVEYFFIQDKPSNQMRFYQAQADIVVEQLIYGWWGSTFVETSALGKPVVCYLRPAWKDFFLKTFPEYSNLPVVEANTQTIYDVLKKLVTDADYRRQKGEESRRFAEAHFDPEKNTAKLINLLEVL
jgi:glycosyltransferase involved in cell wall biosynthesis